MMNGCDGLIASIRLLLRSYPAFARHPSAVSCRLFPNPERLRRPLRSVGSAPRPHVDLGAVAQLVGHRSQSVAWHQPGLDFDASPSSRRDVLRTETLLSA